jgi:hypothetical protein
MKKTAPPVVIFHKFAAEMIMKTYKPDHNEKNHLFRLGHALFRDVRGARPVRQGI